MKKINHTDILECRIRYKRLQVPVTVSSPGTVLHHSSEISFSERYSTVPYGTTIPVPISVFSKFSKKINISGDDTLVRTATTICPPFTSL